MKLFLLFLFVSFTLGVTRQEATVQQRHWVMAGVVTVLTIIYFSFDRFI